MKHKKKIFSLLIALLILLTATGNVFACDGEGEDPDVNCEVLPDEPVTEVAELADATYTVDAAIPGSGNAAMTGDLVVEGEIFEDTTAVCAEQNDVIYIEQPTDFSLGLVTDALILNAIAAEYGTGGYTEEDAYLRGTQIDDAMETAASSGIYDEVIRLVRDTSGDIPDPTIDWIGGNEIVSSWWGSPNNMAQIQSLLFWIPECEVEVVDPNPPAPKPTPKPTPPAPKPTPKPTPNINTGGDNPLYLLVMWISMLFN